MLDLDGIPQCEPTEIKRTAGERMSYGRMVRNSDSKKLPRHSWHRDPLTEPAPEFECARCHLKGHCHTSEMCREVNVFGTLIKQTMQIIECRHCLHEVVLGSMDLPMGKNATKLGRFNLRKLSKDERVAPLALVGREVKK